MENKKTALTQREQIDFSTFKEIDMLSTADPARDLPWHGGTWGNESWFACANLEGGGHRIGFLAHALIMSLPGKGDVLSVKVSVTDQTTGWYKACDIAYPVQVAEVLQDRFKIGAEGFLMEGDMEGVAVKVQLPDMGIDVALEKRADVLHVGNGLSFSFLGAEQYDFAIPAMATSGEVVIEGETFEVSGPTWLDRQWGGLPNYYAKGDSDETRMRWMWANPQLSNGINISLGFMMLLGPNVVGQYAGIQFPDGSCANGRIANMRTFDWWESPATGNAYPTRFAFDIPCIEASFEIVASPAEQEIVARLKESTKYEGAADVTGTVMGEPVTGACYIELVGSWR